MAKSARVLAIEDVDTLAAALVRFAEEAQAALADLDLEIRRASQWMEQDRPRYWEVQVRRGWEELARARRELEQARMIHRVGDVPSSCIDQKKALQRAQNRLDLSMTKQQSVRQWAYRTAKQTEEYRGKVGPLVEWLAAEYPRALAALRRMARALESYVGQEAVPSPKSLLEAVEGLASASRGGPDEAPSAPSPAVLTQTDSETPARQPDRAAAEAEPIESEQRPPRSDAIEPPATENPVKNSCLPESGG